MWATGESGRYRERSAKAKCHRAAVEQIADPTDPLCVAMSIPEAS